MRIAIFGNTYQGERLPEVTAFISALCARSGAQVVIERSFYDYLGASGIEVATLAKAVTPDAIDADIVLSFGGDGTYLRAAGAVIGKDIPVMGINTGHLGYLAGASIEEAHATIDDILAGRIIVERRSMLMVGGDSPALPTHRYALNEVAILKQDSASMLTIPTTLNGMPLARYQADGLLISTPTGSTAYNLSVGGPIVDPAARVTVISPVAPHSLTMRPLVVEDSCVIGVEPDSRTATYRLSIDGRSTSLPSGTPLTISHAPYHTLLARTSGTNYLDTLRTKLFWGK